VAFDYCSFLKVAEITNMCGPTQLNIAPTEVKFEFLKSSFFVVAVFLWPNRVVIRINMHQEATRPPPTWPLGGVKAEKNIFSIHNIYWGNISI
jgi:hypothetical protein